MYQTTVIFGTPKDGSLNINGLALNKCRYRNVFQKWRQLFVKNGYEIPVLYDA